MKEESVYCICGLYYEVDKFNGRDCFYGKQRFLGVEGKYRIYVYEEKPTEKTLLFKTKKEANEYISKHLSYKANTCTQSHIIVKITFD